ncbi:peptidase domain-containing ABC transporter [Chitinophaga polysaccharea]|uniref:peptidase domain-containing ABC transporter n=1 Tax=Chitinophaga polysaccharea TaxID=1293035 RepID=UPI00115ACE24|nr:peptidase domain-containing ABC transporter [Chitinophaga polysaccharea]
MAFPTYRQLDFMDCGPTCLRMIAKYYGRNYDLAFLRSISFISREGVSLLGISDAAEKIGFRTFGTKTTFEQLINEAPTPCILHWKQNHFVVLPPQRAKRGRSNNSILIADPAHGLVEVDQATFIRFWVSKGGEEGIALFLEPTDAFYQENDNSKQEQKNGFLFLLNYLRPYKKYLIQVVISLLMASILSLILPFLTQGLVDYGINHQDIGFVNLILLSQLVLFGGNTTIEIIRNRLLLQINSRINVSILGDFLTKLMKLPVRFFDTKLIGDLHQRIADHQRIQDFLTGPTLNVAFSFVNFIVFMAVLSLYDLKIASVFLTFSLASLLWILFFSSKRKDLDYKRFQRMSEHENAIFELITGVKEIKLNNCETIKRWQWEKIQAQLFKINIKSLTLGQYQQMGSSFFNQLKNILISFMSAKEVIDGNMSLGMMLSISYIIGQMNGPLEQLLEFIHDAQDAKLSLDRLSEIHGRNEETKGEYGIGLELDTGEVQDISFANVSFKYDETSPNYILRDIRLTIPAGKITAIVGTSGSGKSTLLKLLLKFYEPSDGAILVGRSDLKNISPSSWRSRCGTVMQEGFIFSDSIINNISISDEHTDRQKVHHAVSVANIQEYIEELPLGYQTKIGNSGNGISSGQSQRIQIARAVYKDPKYLFFDEATSALDANNERTIMKNLDSYFEGRTVFVIAHRLSTVKNAHQIVVLEKGEIVEVGTHEQLTHKKGYYYELVKNQLELGT